MPIALSQTIVRVWQGASKSKQDKVALRNECEREKRQGDLLIEKRQSLVCPSTGRIRPSLAFYSHCSLLQPHWACSDPVTKSEATINHLTTALYSKCHNKPWLCLYHKQTTHMLRIWSQLLKLFASCESQVNIMKLVEKIKCCPKWTLKECILNKKILQTDIHFNWHSQIYKYKSHSHC